MIHGMSELTERSNYDELEKLKREHKIILKQLEIMQKQLQLLMGE